MLLAYLIVLLTALALLLAGSYFWLRRQRLHSDPVLITGCYLGSALLLGASLTSLSAQ